MHVTANSHFLTLFDISVETTQIGRNPQNFKTVNLTLFEVQGLEPALQGNSLNLKTVKFDTFSGVKGKIGNLQTVTCEIFGCDPGYCWKKVRSG